MNKNTWLTYKQAAAYRNCSIKTMQRDVRSGMIPVHKIHDKGHPRFLLAEIDAALQPENAEAVSDKDKLFMAHIAKNIAAN